MTVYIIFILILIGLFVGLFIWIYRLIRLYRKGSKKSFIIQITILTLLVIFVTWEFHIFPLSENFFIKKQTTQLTGKSFWCWKEFSYDEWGIRGEGYTLYIYRFNQETAEYFANPDSTFFMNYPLEINSQIQWTPTPVKNEEMEILEFATPLYAGWKGEIVTRQDFIRAIATREGAYYAYKHGGMTDFYIISPKDRLVILINHNM